MTAKASQLKAVEAQEAQRRLSKEELLNPRIREDRVLIPDLGGEIVMRSLSYATRAELRSRCGFGSEENWDDELFTLLCIVHSVVDPQLTEDDIPAIKEWDQGVFDDMVLKVTLLNMLGRTDPLKKDSPTTGSSDSASN